MSSSQCKTLSHSYVSPLASYTQANWCHQYKDIHVKCTTVHSSYPIPWVYISHTP